MPESLPTHPLTKWEVLRDPARPNWPGVLVTTHDMWEGFISVEAGMPRNFADSKALADRIVSGLESRASLLEADRLPDEQVAQWVEACLAGAGELSTAAWNGTGMTKAEIVGAKVHERSLLALADILPTLARSAHPPEPTEDHAEIEFCGQCGELLSSRACGPTHAMIWVEMSARAHPPEKDNNG